jgi:DNA-binding FadR family transcriptional regulator
MTFTPTQVLRPREQVETQIREAILSGSFAQGDKLPPESVLARQFSVSRTTVREALRSLASAGLIAKIPGITGGSFVQTVDHRALGSALGSSLLNTVRLGSVSPAEVRELRRLLEIPAAALAAQHRTEAHLEVIDAIVAREKTATIDDPDVPDLDVGFHSAVGDAAGNRPLSAFISALHQVVRPAARIRLSPEVGRKTVRQHLQIASAIRSQDASGASESMAAHLDYLSSIARDEQAT